MSEWYFYLIRTRYGALYAGITTDVCRRLTEHENSEKGAKYLRSKGPLRLAYQVKVGNRNLALKVEHCVKKLPKLKKEQIIEENPGRATLLKFLRLELLEIA